MFDVVTRITASVGSRTNGSGTSSTRTSRCPCQVTAFMGLPSSGAVAGRRSRTGCPYRRRRNRWSPGRERNGRGGGNAVRGVTAADAPTLFDDLAPVAQAAVDDRMLRVRRVYAEPAAADSPRGRQVLARFPDAEVVEVP